MIGDCIVQINGTLYVNPAGGYTTIRERAALLTPEQADGIKKGLRRNWPDADLQVLPPCGTPEAHARFKCGCSFDPTPGGGGEGPR